MDLTMSAQMERATTATIAQSTAAMSTATLEERHDLAFA
jgi:hypothetical protein